MSGRTRPQFEVLNYPRCSLKPLDTRNCTHGDMEGKVHTKSNPEVLFDRN